MAIKTCKTQWTEKPYLEQPFTYYCQLNKTNTNTNTNTNNINNNNNNTKTMLITITIAVVKIITVW